MAEHNTWENKAFPPPSASVASNKVGVCQVSSAARTFTCNVWGFEKVSCNSTVEGVLAKAVLLFEKKIIIKPDQEIYQ